MAAKPLSTGHDPDTGIGHMDIGDLFRGIPDQLPEEFSERLAHGRNVRIERIVSHGHASPPDYWYDQADNEWVLLVKGRARLRFEHGDRLVDLSAGMHVNIAAREKHRVEWTDPDQDTVWLAVFY